MLERWKSSGKLKPPFILQEKIEGIEMAVGGWLGPHGFSRGWCESFEFKKLFNGDLGCATGEQGTVLRYVRSSKLANKMLKPFEETLVEEGFTGYVDVNCIIDAKGVPWPLEFTMRPGWPTMNIQQALHEGDAVQWLADLCDGIDDRNFREDEIAIGIVMSIPDYPYSHITRKEVTGIPIHGATPELWEHIHPCEMMQSEAPDIESMKPTKMPATAGDYVLVMSAVGGTVRAAKDTAYKRLKKLEVPNSPMYRTDIGDRLKLQLPELQRHGYAVGMQYSSVKPPPPKPKEEGEVIGGIRIFYV
jgi:phosphoribosylamine---glycine ligase